MACDDARSIGSLLNHFRPLAKVKFRSGSVVRPEVGHGQLWVASVSSAPWAAVIGADSTVLTPRHRWLCLQYLGYQSLGPLLEWRLNDRNVAETVSWATPGD